MNAERDFGNSSPVIRYSPDESRCKTGRGAAATTGFRNKGLYSTQPKIAPPNEPPRPDWSEHAIPIFHRDK